MRTFILLLVLLLAGAGVMDGQNSCLDPDSDDYRCEAEDDDVKLNDCSLTDGDIPGVVACLDNVGRDNIASLDLQDNDLTTLPADLFQKLGVLVQLYLVNNKLSALPPGLFDGLGKLLALYLEDNQLTTLPEGLFNELGSLQTLYLRGNPGLQCVPDTRSATVFVDDISSDQCECTPAEAVKCNAGFDCTPGTSGYTCGANPCFDQCQSGALILEFNSCGLANEDIPDLVKCFEEVGRVNINILLLRDNKLTALPSELFDGLGKLRLLTLDGNDLTTLPEGLFNELGSLETLYLQNNPGLQCVPDTGSAVVTVDDISSDQCECTPAEAVKCREGFDCAPGASGYTCEIAMHKLGGALHLSDVRSTDFV